MSRRRVAVVLLACTLAGATGLRMAAGAEKRGITHDEAISYLAAACNEGEYARLTFGRRPPYGRWAPASEWKALLRPARPLCLATIARDLGDEDIHPPLYFWLLHGWALVFGVGTWTGVSLNIVLAGLTTLALFGLARRVLGDPLRAALVAFAWSFSPAAIRVFFEARQYELLALLAVLFMWQCVRLADPATRPRGRDLAVLAALTAAGALSQFLFAVVAVAGLVLLLVRRRSEMQAIAPVAAVAAGYLGFALLDPAFLASLARGRSQAADPALHLLDDRVERSVSALAEFLLPPGAAVGLLAYAAAAALLAAAAWLSVEPERSDSEGGEAGGRAGRAMVLVFVWLVVANGALYLAFVSPASAMDFKHLSTIWPFAAFVPVMALDRLSGRTRTTVAVACAGAVAVAGAVAALSQTPRRTAPPPALERARRVALDNVARGVLLRVTWRTPDRAEVFAADQRYLLAHPREWLPELAPGDLVIAGLPASDPRYGNSRALGRRVTALATRRRRLASLADPLEPGHVFRVQEIEVAP